MVDLSELKVGDKVRFRNGKVDIIKEIRPINKRGYDYKVKTDYIDSFYRKDGYYRYDKLDVNDIIEIIPQSKEESDKLKVDLHIIAEGDVVYFDDGSEAVVDDVMFDEHFVDLYFYDFGTFEFNYDGTKFNEDAEVGNIIHVLHGAPKPAEKSDPVNHPSHYASGGIECIAAIKASMSAEEYRGYLKGNVIKYLWRYENKGKPVEDLKKAKVYIEWLIKEVSND